MLKVTFYFSHILRLFFSFEEAFVRKLNIYLFVNSHSTPGWVMLVENFNNLITLTKKTNTTTEFSFLLFLV